MDGAAGSAFCWHAAPDLSLMAPRSHLACVLLTGRWLAQVQPLQGLPQVTINDFREYLAQMAELMQRFEVLCVCVCVRARVRRAHVAPAFK